MTTNGNGTTTKGYFFEDLAVGMEASYAKKITNDDVLAFADLSGDTNPVHLDDAYAAGTMFKQRIAHGFLTASLFSTVLGTKLPGPGCIYLSQNLKFRAPVHIGDEVVATGKITSLESSFSFAMPIIVINASILDPKLGADQLRIQLGYPAPEFFNRTMGRPCSAAVRYPSPTLRSSIFTRERLARILPGERHGNHGISINDAMAALGNPCPLRGSHAEKETPSVTQIRPVGYHLQDRWDRAVPAPRWRSTHDL